MDLAQALLQKFCPENIRLAAEFFAAHLKMVPTMTFVLGSGWDRVLWEIEVVQEFDYREFFALPDAIPGHRYRIVMGQWKGRGILFFMGRLHLYQGYSPWEVAFPVLFSALAGVSTLILTNAAGSLRRSIEPGTLVIIQDQIDFTFFPDFPCSLRPSYDSFLSSLLFELACEKRIKAWKGIYVGVLGPTYETPQEIRMLRKIGADVVGMSTVKEVKLACELGMKVAGISLVTNWGSGISGKPLSHAEVLRVVAQQEENLQKLFQCFVEELYGANCSSP
ncbi:purine-nucleoside phosphorylase [Thermatribacter velox]|uniref:purine-nucleoside phosphorylase n=1 Tax=Thermatribacter velox TaxID=3039681 RepID=A0ABZ2Y8K4_9BACT|nr:purine-nucleoside phosphorylase [Candidatus Atribacteria bacterium]